MFWYPEPRLSYHERGLMGVRWRSWHELFRSLHSKYKELLLLMSVWCCEGISGWDQHPQRFLKIFLFSFFLSYVSLSFPAMRAEKVPKRLSGLLWTKKNETELICMHEQTWAVTTHINHIPRGSAFKRIHDPPRGFLQRNTYACIRIHATHKHAW